MGEKMNDDVRQAFRCEPIERKIVFRAQLDWDATDYGGKYMPLVKDELLHVRVDAQSQMILDEEWAYGSSIRGSKCGWVPPSFARIEVEKMNDDVRPAFRCEPIERKIVFRAQLDWDATDYGGELLFPRS